MKIQNKSRGILYARVILQGVPAAGEEKAASSNLTIDVNFTDLKGGKIDISKLPQGTDFICEIKIGNPGLMGHYYNLALTSVFPSGWEIHNTRMDEFSGRVKNDPYDYQDFRDDRVNTFFGLQTKVSKTYRVMLNASYLGRFYLPGFVAQAMYDNTINASSSGKWVEVVPYDEKTSARK